MMFDKSAGLIFFVRLWFLFFLQFFLVSCSMDYDLEYFYQDKRVIALAKAAARGRVDDVEKLVASGVDVNTIGKDGMTPLLWVLKEKNKKGFLCLLKYGADPNIPTKIGESVMSFSAMIDDSDYLRMVLKYGGDPNLVNPVNKVNPTPIFRAIGQFNRNNVRALIDAGADLNYQDSSGETPLIFSAELNQWDIVYDLLTTGADYSIKDNTGYTIVYSIENNNIDTENELYKWRQKVISFLRKRGVTVNPKIP